MMPTDPKPLIQRLPLTGIGSLPHANRDSAIEFSLRFDIPFVPQIPVRNPAEAMVAQALEGLPGLHPHVGGLVTIERAAWEQGAPEFRMRLQESFQRQVFSDWLPSPEAYSCLQPFLFECEELRLTRAKVQLAGPLTTQWAVRLTDGTPIDRLPELASTVLQLVLARALALVDALKSHGVSEPWIFLDEPALFAGPWLGDGAQTGRMSVGFAELGWVIQSLKKSGARVGLHCCSNTDWRKLLGLGLDALSIDVRLSLPSLLEDIPALQSFHDQGGRLVLGVVPTHLDREEMESAAMKTVELIHLIPPQLQKEVLSRAWLSPACGLALMSPEDAEWVLSTLMQLQRSL